MKISIATILISTLAFNMTLHSAHASEMTSSELDSASTTNNVKRIPWLKPSLPVDTVIRPLPSSQPAIVKKTPAEIEAAAFNRAFDQLKAARYKESISLFQRFINAYPESEKVVDSHYWIGEACYLAKDYAGALEKFSHIIIYYADHEFATQATLKAGYTYYKMQNWPKALTFLQRVASNHPNTSYANRAKSQLKRMKREKQI